MKMGLWIQQCTHAPEDVNKVTQNHTIAVSGEFRVNSLSLQKMILGLRDVLIAAV